MNLSKLFRPKKLAIIGGYWADFVFDENIKIGFKGKINWDKSKPDGTPEKCLDISLAKKYGWKPKNDYHKGFDTTFKDYQKNY